MTKKPYIDTGLVVSLGIIAALLAADIVQAETVKSTQFVTAPNVVTADTNDPDTRLQSWLNRNVDNHPSVLAAKSAVDSAGYQMVAADKALYNPELEIDAETAESDIASIGLSQTIDWGNIRGARTEMAGLQKIATQYAYESTRHTIAVELLSGLSDLHSSSALKVLAEQGKNLMQRSAKLAKQRFDAGDLGQVEVDLANLSYAQARFKLVDAITLHAKTRQNLIALTGSTDTNWPELPSSYPDPGSETPDVNKTVQQLPKMLEITTRVKAAQANINVQRGQGTAQPTFAFRTGRENEDTLIGLTFSVPIQIRNNYKAEVDAANAEMIQAERESIDAYRKLKSRLEVSIVSYQLSREAWLEWEQSGADTLSEQIILLERLWESGEMNTTDYLIQLKQALETKASAIEQRGHMWSSWSEWLIASGQIEHWLYQQHTTNTRQK